MNEFQDMEPRLWEYIDGSGDATERSAIEQLISQHAEWKALYAELLEVHRLLRSSELEEPSMRFTLTVMEEIGRLQISAAARSYINKKIVWSIAIFFFLSIAACLAYSLGSVDWKSIQNHDPDLRIDLTKLDFNSLFNNGYVNLFLLLNVMLGLMLADRYLSARRKRVIRKN